MANLWHEPQDKPWICFLEHAAWIFLILKFASFDSSFLCYILTKNWLGNLPGCLFGLFTAAILFKVIFEDIDDFIECLKYWLQGDFSSSLRGEREECRWDTPKLIVWIVLSAGGACAYYQLPKWFPKFLTQSFCKRHYLLAGTNSRQIKIIAVDLNSKSSLPQILHLYFSSVKQIIHFFLEAWLLYSAHPCSISHRK